MINKNDLIYLAGFFDGEGCITHSGYWFRITISNTNKDILVWIQSVFGGHINNQHLPKNPKHNMAWKWIIANRKDLVPFLVSIIPYLKVKKPEAQLVLSYMIKKDLNKNRHVGIPILDKEEFEQVKQQLIKLKSDLHYNRD